VHRFILIAEISTYMKKTADPISKHPSQKGLREWLKVKGLSSNPSTARKAERQGGSVNFSNKQVNINIESFEALIF
jgi:hypothetical protein